MKKYTTATVYAFVAAFMMISTNLFAEVIITDINPDYIVPINTQYQIDLNNDGTDDLKFTNSWAAGGSCSNELPVPRYINSYSNVSKLQGVFEVAFQNGLAAALNLDDTIYQWETLTTNVLLQITKNSCQNGTIFGNWNSDSARYLPLRFNTNGDWFYGWVKMKVHVGGIWKIQFTIEEYAFNNTPNEPIFFDQSSFPEGIANVQPDVLLLIRPNPVRESTLITFTLPQSEFVSIKVLEMNGRLVSNLASTLFTEGPHQIGWNAEGINSGVYLLKLRVNEDAVETRKIIVER